MARAGIVHTDLLTGEQVSYSVINDENAVVNFSTTPYLQLDLNNPDKKTKMLDQQPKEGFDAQVAIADVVFNEGEGTPVDGVYPVNNSVKPRSALVFHELKESFYRTTKNLPYIYIEYDRFGKGVGKGFFPGEYKEDKSRLGQGAHGLPKLDEQRFHEPSKYPGLGSPVKR